ncbi:S-layer homology domain-containing protein, partial [Candidatus Peregrinibacteria bacterium]|nr:S-layer homology domain-containing protein [Candidatus Peregrinibacteria bacterium]
MKNHFLRLFAGLLFLLLSIQTGLAADSLAFSDTAGSPYEDQIDYLSEKGIVNGYADGTFRPNNRINRAEFVKLIVEQLKGKPSVNDYEDCFKDVKTGWFEPYVCYAKEKGMVNGYPDGTFMPSNTINKVEALKIVVSAYDLDLENDVELPFDDIDEDSWYIGYLKTAFAHNLLKEKSGHFGPGNLMTRGEMSDIIYRLFSVLEYAGEL